jgi:hypothetical protein
LEEKVKKKGVGRKAKRVGRKAAEREAENRQVMMASGRRQEEQQQHTLESPAPARGTKEAMVERDCCCSRSPTMQNLWLSDKSKHNSNAINSSWSASLTGIAARVLFCPRKDPSAEKSPAVLIYSWHQYGARRPFQQRSFRQRWLKQWRRDGDYYFLLPPAAAKSTTQE